MKTTNLPNGLKIFYEESKASRVTSIQIWVACGSVNESKQINGISHFIEHILFKGTKNHSLGGVADAIEKMGGELNAFTAKDYTCYYATVPTIYYKEAMSVLRDLVFSPLMNDKDIEDEREVILEEIRRYLDIPSSLASDGFYEVQFKDHPYGMPIQGYDKVVEKIATTTIKEYYSKFYVPSNAIVVLCGDTDEKEVLNTAANIFGDINNGGTLNIAIPQSEPLKEPGCKIYELDVKEAVLYFGFSIPNLMHKDVPALDLLSNILGQSESSRLVKKLRVEKGVVTSISTSSYTPKHAGSFVVGFSFDGEPSKIKASIKDILDEIFKEFKRLKVDGLDKDELVRSKNMLLSEKIYERRTVDGMASRLGRLISVTGGVDFEEKYIESIKTVSSSDVMAVFDKYIISGITSISAAVPNKSDVTEDDLISIFTKEIKKLASNSAKKAPSTDDQRIELDVGTLRAATNEQAKMIKNENGASVILKRLGSIPLCSLYICFPGGVSFEDDRTNGISNLTSRTLVYGAGNLAYDEITKKMDGSASFFDVFSGRDAFGLSLTVLKPYFEEILDTVKTIMVDPKFNKTYFNTEKKVIEDEIKSAEDNLSSYTHNLFLKTIYQKNQYRLDPLGTMESIKSISNNDVNDFYDGILNPQKMIISFAGDFEEDSAIKWSNDLTSMMKGKGNRRQNIIDEPKQEGPRHVVFKKDSKQAHVIFGYKSCNVLNEDVNALKVLTGVLLGQSGRLFINLRDKQSLAYSVFPMQMFAKQFGYFAVYIATEHAKVDKSILEIRSELDRLKQVFVSDEELKRSKNYLIGLKEIELQTSCAQALNMGLYEFYGLGFKKIFNYSENIMKITKEDIQRVAIKYFVEDKENLVILTK